MKRKLVIMLLGAGLSLGSVGCQRPAETPQSTPAGTPWKGKTHLVASAARANFPRMITWLYNGLYNEFPHREFTGEILFTGSGYAIEMINIIEGRAQLAVVTPSATAHMALHGVGLFSKPYPNLRGLFKIGQHDPMTLAVPVSLGVKSFDEVIQKKIPIKIAVGFQDGDDTTGFFFKALMEAYGSSIEELRSWGGDVIEVSTSTPGMAKILAGEADSIFHEAMVIASPRWKEVNDKTPMRVLSIPEDVIQKLGQFGFRKFDKVLKKGTYPGLLEDVTTVDYSDWIVIGDASIPDDVAYKIAKVAVETIPAWVSQAPPGSLHTEESGELGNLVPNPKTMWKDLGAPLHPGAERYYKEMGLMP
ncbi:MAG: hypothetical protein HYX73_04950 [Acidobacteria bacterium]|nr:hypothetical protein [Acidobacteriota bacterium]